LVVVARFFPGRAKDLSAPRVYWTVQYRIIQQEIFRDNVQQ